MYKLYTKYKADASLYRSVPRYSDFTLLKQDLLPASTNQLTTGAQIVVGGTVSCHADTILKSKYTKKEGVAKRVVTYKCFLEKNNDSYDDKEKMVVPDECGSVPFRLKDKNGESIRVDSVHEATRFKDFVTHACRKRIEPSEPPQLIRSREPNGERVDEFLLLQDISFYLPSRTVHHAIHRCC